MGKATNEEIIEQQIKGIALRVGELEKEVWLLKNPQKFAVRDRVRESLEHCSGIVVSIGLFTQGPYRCWEYSVLRDNYHDIVQYKESILTKIGRIIDSDWEKINNIGGKNE